METPRRLGPMQKIPLPEAIPARSLSLGWSQLVDWATRKQQDKEAENNTMNRAEEMGSAEK